MKPESIRILLIEDNPGDARLLSIYLSESRRQEFVLHHVDKISEGIRSLNKQAFHVVLLDLSLPDATGLESVKRICSIIPQIPIIVLTGLEDDAMAIELVQYGAQDYLVKNQVNGQILVRAMLYAIERKKMEERLHYLAMHDSLTNLPNRALFQDRLSQALERAQRSRLGKFAKWETAVLLLDLDDFKSVNDTFGHLEGDRLLQAVAERLTKCIRQSDTVARMGGDEFTLIFENLSGQEDAKNMAEKILDVISQPFQLSNEEIKMTASIGISLFPSDGYDFLSLLKAADIAMYSAKCDGNRYRFFGDCRGEP